MHIRQPLLGKFSDANRCDTQGCAILMNHLFSPLRQGPDLGRVIDAMGEASRIAQNLRKPVTVASAFSESNQTLYIMTEPTANK